jgi:formate hydrogenlyase subunit 6/NADH:ubiquinone oxidoreductase subunit I
MAERDRVREAANRRVEENNTDHVPPRPPEEALAELQDSPRWNTLGAGCVECGACTQICPTCHCFYLRDQQNKNGDFERHRAWDSCVWSGYSRMAGPADMKPNPRSRFQNRMANRFLHKYVWSLKQYDTLGCVGCGRCIEACPGRIDIRKVIREVSA